MKTILTILILITLAALICTFTGCTTTQTSDGKSTVRTTRFDAATTAQIIDAADKLAKLVEAHKGAFNEGK